MYISIDIDNNICYSFYVIKESIETRRYMNEIQILDKIKIEDYIYEIRGKHVMLDFGISATKCHDYLYDKIVAHYDIVKSMSMLIKIKFFRRV